MIKAAKFCALPTGSGNWGFVCCKPPVPGRKRADRSPASSTKTALSLSLEAGASAVPQTPTPREESEKRTHKTISRYLEIDNSSHPR